MPDGDRPRAHRTLGAVLLLVAVGAVCARTFRRLGAANLRGNSSPAESVCHPTLSHLRDRDGREVLIIGALPLDLDGKSRSVVQSALGAWKPDVVMVEGNWNAAVTAMLHAGKWAFHGQPALGSENWTDIGDAAPVELPKPKKRGVLTFGGPPPRWPDRSLVPIKVGSWAQYLRTSVGGDIATAVAAAAAADVPVRFLGLPEGGFQGHMQVTLLAQQAAMELLEEEQHRGAQMKSADIDAALRRAEGHVREDAVKWLKDARGETSKRLAHMREKLPEKVYEDITKKIEARTVSMADRISSTMKDFRRGAVVVSINQLVGVESKLVASGHSFLSECA